MKNKYCVIGIYFGHLRKDFPLWLKSCETNNDIDFILVTDADISHYNIPTNVTIYHSTLEQVRNLATSKLGFEVCIDTPYKLCDFKPTFGIIFEDLISDYKYWGHCDFDLMFGRIGYFTQFYNIENYIHFLTQGHLSFYRNIPELKEFLNLDGSYVNANKVFRSNKNYAFDENYGIGSIYCKNQIPQFTKNIYADLSPIFSRMRRSPYYPLDAIPKDYNNQLFIWKSGKAIWLYVENEEIKEEEVLYIHYQKRHLTIDIESILKAETIIFTPKSIIGWNGPISIQDIANLNPKSEIQDLLDISKWKIKKTIKRIASKLRK